MCQCTARDLQWVLVFRCVVYEALHLQQGHDVVTVGSIGAYLEA